MHPAEERFYAGRDARELRGQNRECEEKHSHTTAHHPVVKPPAVVSTCHTLQLSNRVGETTRNDPVIL